MRIVELDINKARRKGYIVDREKLLEKYSISNKYTMLNGMPLVICVDCLYIKANDILDVCLSNKNIVSNWLLELKQLPNNRYRGFEFRWKR